MEKSTLLLEDVAEAFTKEGRPMKALFGSIVKESQVRVPKNGVLRFLGAENIDPEARISKISRGARNEELGTLSVVSDKDSRSVSDMLETLVKIFHTDEFPEELGQGSMPKDFGGVRFHVFRPAARKIITLAEYWTPDWAKDGGYWVAEVPLRIAARKIEV